MEKEDFKDKEIEVGGDGKEQSLRITMASTNAREIERVSSEIIRIARDAGATCKSGASSLKNKKLTVTTRRSPCGNGSNTYDKYTMVVRKRYVDITATCRVFKEITSSISSPDVLIQVVVVKA
jgi:small subunit ribosomal protein S20e